MPGCPGGGGQPDQVRIGHLGPAAGIAGELADSRRKQPRDDIVTQLLKPDDAGLELTTLEFNFFFLLLTVAGNETTRNAASGGMLAFFEHPDQWQRLVADPALAASAAAGSARQT